MDGSKGKHDGPRDNKEDAGVEPDPGVGPDDDAVMSMEDAGVEPDPGAGPDDDAVMRMEDAGVEPDPGVGPDDDAVMRMEDAGAEPETGAGTDDADVRMEDAGAESGTRPALPRRDPTWVGPGTVRVEAAPQREPTATWSGPTGGGHTLLSGRGSAEAGSARDSETPTEPRSVSRPPRVRGSSASPPAGTASPRRPARAPAPLPAGALAAAPPPPATGGTAFASSRGAGRGQRTPTGTFNGRIEGHSTGRTDGEAWAMLKGATPGAGTVLDRTPGGAGQEAPHHAQPAAPVHDDRSGLPGHSPNGHSTTLVPGRPAARSDQSATLRVPLSTGSKPSPQLPPWPSGRSKRKRQVAVACVTLALLGAGGLALSALSSGGRSAPHTSQAGTDTNPAAGRDLRKQPEPRDMAAETAPLPQPAQPATAMQAPMPDDVRLLAATSAELERAAVDALIAGDYAQALASYRELARRDPTPAFTAAVRILEVTEAPGR